MADNEARARAMLLEAEKKLTSFSFFDMFSSGNTKFEEAAAIYTKAANLFKIVKKCRVVVVHGLDLNQLKMCKRG